jgi:hypothetical protein
MTINGSIAEHGMNDKKYAILPLCFLSGILSSEHTASVVQPNPRSIEKSSFDRTDNFFAIKLRKPLSVMQDSIK